MLTASGLSAEVAHQKGKHQQDADGPEEPTDNPTNGSAQELKEALAGTVVTAGLCNQPNRNNDEQESTHFFTPFLKSERIL